MFNDLNLISGAQSMYRHVDNDAQLRAHATRLFERTMRRTLPNGAANFLSRLGRKAARPLCSLAEIASGRHFSQQHYIGLQTVPLERIVGTENRSTEFDRDFIPQAEHLQSRWVSVAMAALKELSLPPVDLIQVGDHYYVRDGHHRISVARYFNQATIMATVTVWE